MSDRETMAVYAKAAADYAMGFARSKDTFHEPDYEAFTAGLPSGGSVLDLGCGPSIAEQFESSGDSNPCRVTLQCGRASQGSTRAPWEGRYGVEDFRRLNLGPIEFCCDVFFRKML